MKEERPDRVRFVYRPWADRAGVYHERYSEPDECTLCGRQAECTMFSEERYGVDWEIEDMTPAWRFVRHLVLCKECAPPTIGQGE